MTIIRVQHVVKSFGKVTAVNDVSFDVRAGEIFAFLGPNGAGKTTTIKMLTTLLRMFELWERRDDLVKTFSGGMKRRLEIARGLLHTPKVLFLDEPTLGLDPQSRNQMWTLVQNLNKAEGVTVFLTTHYMDEADRVADRIAVIDHGRIVAIGSSAELKQQTGTDSLEAAFLKLTGTSIRDESATAADQMRQVSRVWRR